MSSCAGPAPAMVSSVSNAANGNFRQGYGKSLAARHCLDARPRPPSLSPSGLSHQQPKCVFSFLIFAGRRGLCPGRAAHAGREQLSRKHHPLMQVKEGGMAMRALARISPLSQRHSHFLPQNARHIHNRRRKP